MKWSENKQFRCNDIVEYNQKSYLATVNHISDLNNSPVNSYFWSYFGPAIDCIDENNYEMPSTDEEIKRNEKYVLEKQMAQSKLGKYSKQEYDANCQKTTLYYQTLKQENDVHRCEWVMAFGNRIPNDAIPLGKEKDGTLLFGARVFYKNTIQLGKCSVNMKKGCSIPFDGGEVFFEEFEVLVGNPKAVKWIDAEFPCVPLNINLYKDHFLVLGGVDNGGKPLFISQAFHEGGFHCGKVNDENMYISFNGKEVVKTVFRVLVYNVQLSKQFILKNGLRYNS